MSPIRVIAGSARGRRLRSVPGSGTRPVGDRVKESLFNIIGPEIQGARFLDLFAGTGSVGIEALSRGAEHVLFLESAGRACQVIRANLVDTGLQAGAQVQQADVFQALKNPPAMGFDYIYVAPPQYQGLWSRAVTSLDLGTGWLSPDAWVIAQLDPQEYRSLELGNLKLLDQRRYGRTLLVFYDFPGA